MQYDKSLIRSAMLVAALTALMPMQARAAGEVVGTAAAVNPDAQGNSRLINLGATVVHNEHIRTSTNGSVQVLFVDHTTLNIGPNSNLVIDDFVYDPKTRTGKMALTLGKGVLRFVGGQTSHTNGATIKTPTTTLAIRGGVSTVLVNGSTGATQGINHFGTLTFEGGSPLTISRPDFMASVLSRQGGPTGVQRVPIALLQSLNGLLTSRKGQTGGATQRPTERIVQRARLGQSHLGMAPQDIRPQLARAEGSGPPPQQNLLDIVQQGSNQQQQSALSQGTTSPVSFGSPLFEGYQGYAGGLIERRDVNGTLIGSSVSADGVSFGSNLGFIIAASPSDGSSGSFYLFFTSADGVTRTVSAYDSNGQPTTAIASLSEATTLPGIATCACQYTKWGYWEATHPDESGSGTDTLKIGTWVAGTLTPGVDIDGLVAQNATATYTGHAMAAIQSGASQALYAGTFSSAVNFGAGTSTININNLAGKNYSGTGIVSNNYFIGSASTPVSTFTYNATLQGYFYGPNAAEVGGLLAITSNDPTYYGSGIFVGKK